MREAALHSLAVAGFGILAVVWSWPLAWHLSTHLTGAGLGDNAVFAWNFWWMRTALASGTDFFRTSFLFAPVGADLTLHTHTALTAFVGATLLRHLSVVAALNVTILASLTLNGFCAYLLAWQLTRDWGASILAGTIFGTSPYIAAHLNGHFNLINAWTIPLFALAIPPAMNGSRRWAALAGLVLAMTAYVDYYYVVYELALALFVLAGLAWRWSFGVRTSGGSRWLVAAIDTCLVLDAVALVAIMATRGFTFRVGPVPVSMRDTYNPLQLFWVLVALAIWLRLRPIIAARPRESWEWRRFWPPLSVMTAVFTLIAAPLLSKGVGLLVRGQYVTQEYYWRSAPTGIDAATLFFGNPFHGLFGPFVQRFYRVGAGISLVEGGAWLGLAPVGLTIYAVRHRWSDPVVRRWLVVGLMFFAWALGPHLVVLGRDTGMILPETLLRYIPIASNARMPGRAMVGVYLALATLAALAVTDWKAAHRGFSWLVPALCLAVFADFLAAPFPIASVECPHIYQTLRDRPERGALAELPLGIGDGLLGDLTPVDHRMFLCQMTHGHPLVGGVLARIPSNVLPSYEADPLLSGWLRLSGFDDQTSVHTPLPDAARASERMRADGIAFVMLDRERASAPLREYVEHVMPLTLVAVEGVRSLYATR